MIKSYHIGDRVCDMHDGFKGVPIKVTDFVQLRVDGSSEMLSKVLEHQGIDRLPTNKVAVVVDYGTRCKHELLAAYSYDDRWFGTFRFSPVDVDAEHTS